MSATASAQRSTSVRLGWRSETCLPTAVIVVKISSAAKLRCLALARGAADATKPRTMRLPLALRRDRDSERIAIDRLGGVERESQRCLVALGVKKRADRRAQPIVGRPGRIAEDRVERRAGSLPLVELEPEQDRLLVRKVLIQRADTDAGLVGDANRREALRALALENANRGLENVGDELG